MKSILLTFDLEEFDLPKEFNHSISEDKMYGISEQGLNNLLQLLNKYNIRSTFFTTANFANYYPEKIKDLSEKHEIASHGYSHSEPLTLENIKKAKEEKELIIEKPIRGFRAPRWNLQNINIVEKAGFNYDSSSHPIYLPGRYFNLNKNRKLHKINNILEIPASTLPPNFSIFWLAFKNLPLTYSKLFTRLNLINLDYTMLVFHPWEFANLSKIKIPNYIKRKHSKELLKKLEKYILFCKERKYKFQTINDFLEKINYGNIYKP